MKWKRRYVPSDPQRIFFSEFGSTRLRAGALVALGKAKRDIRYFAWTTPRDSELVFQRHFKECFDTLSTRTTRSWCAGRRLRVVSASRSWHIRGLEQETATHVARTRSCFSKTMENTTLFFSEGIGIGEVDGHSGCMRHWENCVAVNKVISTIDACTEGLNEMAKDARKYEPLAAIREFIDLTPPPKSDPFSLNPKKKTYVILNDIWCFFFQI